MPLTLNIQAVVLGCQAISDTVAWASFPLLDIRDLLAILRQGK